MINERSVMFKGTNKGISVYLDENLSFSELKEKFMERVMKSVKFFEGAKSGIVFEGKDLSEEQEAELMEIIVNNTNLEIIPKEKIEMQSKRMFDGIAYIADNEIKLHGDQTVYYKNSVRSGQKISTETSIIVLGDINPGAEVISAGNVTIFGALKGMAHAGCKGDRSAYIAAIGLFPTQLRIADIIASFPKEENKETEKIPTIAYIKDGQMFVETM